MGAWLAGLMRRSCARAQTDGWLSDASAKVYEVSTETLFIARQDAMQRQTLVPLREFMAERSAASGAGTRLLEVAGGTGRFATFLKASLVAECPAPASAVPHSFFASSPLAPREAAAAATAAGS